MLKYNLVSVGNQSNITVFVNGEMYVADQAHPNWQAIVAKAVNNDESVVDHFEVAKAVARKFQRLSDRISVSSSGLTFDGTPVDDALAQQVLDFLDEGVDDWKPLVKFWENLAANPNEKSREHFYRWAAAAKLTITPEGNVIGYKGLRSDYGSITRGPAIVDGESVDGSVPNRIGSVIEMDRTKVTFDPNRHCAFGLHVGTYAYASGFAQGKVVKVEFNPRDVVSVPNDSNGEKVRVCRYTVVADSDGAVKSALDLSRVAPVDLPASDEPEVCDWCLEDVDYCVCDPTEDDDWNEDAPVVVTTSGWDTRQNHTRQQRGPDGRFIKQ